MQEQYGEGGADGPTGPGTDDRPDADGPGAHPSGRADSTGGPAPSTPPGEAPWYDAFVSYSHTARSSEIAQGLQRGLERFARPWYRPRAARIFRDTTDLSVSPQLWGDIESALGRSRWFVLLASPQAAASRWVDREVEWWLEHRSVDRILPVLAEGTLRWDDPRDRFDAEASTALPPRLAGAYTREPLWADLTAAGEGPAPYSQADLQRAVASIAAAIRGVALDVVTGEHLRQQRRTRRMVALVITVLLALSVATGSSLLVARAQRDEAQRAADLAAGRSLVLQSAALRDSQVDRALLTGIAAAALDPSPRSRANLLSTLAGGRYAGTLPDTSSVAPVARFSPSGPILVTAHLSGAAKLWDVTDPVRARPLATVDPHAGPLRSAAFRPDGQLLALGGTDGTVTLVSLGDPTRPAVVARIPAHRSAVRALAFDPAGIRLFSGTENVQGTEAGAVALWDVARPDHPTPVSALPLIEVVLGVATNAAAGAVAIAGTGGVDLWTLDGTRRLSRIDAHTTTVYTAAFGPDGRTLATCGGDHTVRLWDLTKPTAPRELGGLPAFDTVVLDCAIGGGGRTLAAADGGAVTTWDITDPAHPAALARLPGHDGVVGTVAFSADGTLIASGGADARTQLWTTTAPTAPTRVAVTAAGDGIVSSLASAPDGRTVARLWSPSDGHGRGVRLAPGPAGPFADLATTTNGVVVSLSPDGRTVLVGNQGDDDESVLWDVSDPARPRRLGALDVPSLGVEDVSWSADGRLLLIAGQLSRDDTGGGAATLWDVSDPDRPQRLTAQGFGDQAIFAAALRPDGRIAALTSGQQVHLWDITDRRSPRILPGVAASHPALIRSVAFSPRADVLVTGSNDQTVALWPTGDGPRIAALDVVDAVGAVAFTADGGMLAALDDGGATTLWDVADPRLPVRLGVVPSETDDAATSMALAPDGRRLLLGRARGDVEVWDTARLRDLAADPVRAACALTGRGPNEAEWGTWAPERPYRRTC